MQSEEKIQAINRIEEVIQIEMLHNYGVYSLTETEDKRIVSGGYDGNILISSYNGKRNGT